MLGSVATNQTFAFGLNLWNEPTIRAGLAEQISDAKKKRAKLTDAIEIELLDKQIKKLEDEYANHANWARW